jgi:double-strand break repair protein MRE11
LSAAGKIERVDQITNYPILMTKGDSKLALYGMGSVRDERLHRTFEADGVQWAKPQQDPAGWFNIAVVHQNRSGRATDRCASRFSDIVLLLQTQLRLVGN